MTYAQLTGQLHSRYYGRFVRYVDYKMDSHYGIVDSITYESAVGEPQIILLMRNCRFTCDVEWFKDHIFIL